VTNRVIELTDYGMEEVTDEMEKISVGRPRRLTYRASLIRALGLAERVDIVGLHDQGCVQVATTLSYSMFL